MKKDKDIKTLFLAIIAVLFIGALVGGGTFAYWQWQSNEAQKTSVSFTISRPGFTIVGTNVTSNTLTPTQSCYYTATSYSQHTLTGSATVTATNNTTTAMRATITLKGALKHVSTALPSSGSNSAENIHWAIKEVASATTGFSAANCTGTSGATYASGTFSGITSSSASTLTYTDIPTSITFDVPAGQTVPKYYQVYVWIDSAYTATNTGSTVTDPMQGLTVSLTFSESSLFTQY